MDNIIDKMESDLIESNDKIFSDNYLIKKKEIEDALKVTVDETIIRAVEYGISKAMYIIDVGDRDNRTAEHIYGVCGKLLVDAIKLRRSLKK